MTRRTIAMVVVWWLGLAVPDIHAAEYTLAMNEEKAVYEVMLQFAKAGLLQTMQLEQPQADRVH